MSGQRRRGAALEAAILEAAWAEVNAVGYARLTMEAVAERAQTGKQVLYRRWRNRAELVLAAARHHVVSISEQVPDTGVFREDVLAVLRMMARRYEEFGPDLVHGLMAEAHDLDPEFSGIMTGVMTTILERAAERGEVRMAGITPRIAVLPVDLVRHEMLLGGSRLAEDTLTEIVDDIFLPLLRARSRNGPGAVVAE